MASRWSPLAFLHRLIASYCGGGGEDNANVGYAHDPISESFISASL
jgi:hypothetical protein